MRMRIDNCISDLHVADARDHWDCMCEFLGNKNIMLDNQSPSTPEGEDDQGLNHIIIDHPLDDRTRIWNSVQLHQEYIDHSGSKLSRTGLVDELRNDLSGESLVLSSPSYANIITFNNNDLVNLRMLKVDDVTHSIKMVAKQIVMECKAVYNNKTTYMKHIDTDLATDYVSPTLQSLLTAMS